MNTNPMEQKKNRRFLKTIAITAAIAAGAVALAGMASGNAIDAGIQAAPQARLVANLTEKILYTQLGDSIVDMYDIADGKEPYRTPRGGFKIRKLTWNPSWRPPDSEWAKNKKATGPGDPKNPMKVVKIFFKEPDYYIHGTADVGSMGFAESHGCLRMRPEDVMKVGKWLMENGGSPQAENWFMRLIHSRREEKIIYLSQPVPIQVVE